MCFSLVSISPYMLELGGIPVHTEYRCLFFLRYEFLKYRNTGVISITFETRHC